MGIHARTQVSGELESRPVNHKGTADEVKQPPFHARAQHESQFSQIVTTELEPFPIVETEMFADCVILPCGCGVNHSRSEVTLGPSGWLCVDCLRTIKEHEELP